MFAFCHIKFCTGIHIQGNDGSVTLGSSLELNCSTDLPVLTIEWLYDDAVVAQSMGSEAVLVIPVANDSLHDKQYKCRSTTPFGVQERNTTITVSGQKTVSIM